MANTIKLVTDAEGNLQYEDDVPAPKTSSKTSSVPKRQTTKTIKIDTLEESTKKLKEFGGKSMEADPRYSKLKIPKPTQDELEKAKTKRLKEQEAYQQRQRQEQRREMLGKKYQTYIPRTEAEKKELNEYLTLQLEAVGLPKRPVTASEMQEESRKFVNILRNEKNQEILRQRELREAGKDIPIADRALQNIGQGIDELAVGLYALPYTALTRPGETQEMGRKLAGAYGRSVEELVRENQVRRQQLETLPEDASKLEKGVALSSQIAGTLAPTIALAATGLGVPAAAAGVGAVSAIGRGEPEEAAAEGAFGALGAFAGAASEQAAVKIATEAFGKNTLLSSLGRQLVGRTGTAGAGAVINEFENRVRKIPKEAAKVNLLTGAVLDALFYGGAPKQRGKATGLTPRAERALDQFTGIPVESRPTPVYDPKQLNLPSFEEVVKYFDPEMVQAGAKETAENVTQPVKWYYSQLEKVVRDKFPKRLTPQQATVMLRDPKYGIKADEYGYSGLDKLIAAKAATNEVITKDEILDTINSNKIELKDAVLFEEVKWEPKDSNYTQYTKTYGNFRADVDMNSGELVVTDLAGKVVESDLLPSKVESLGEASDALDAYVTKIYGARPATQYNVYRALKGGTPGSYREILIKLPVTEAQPKPIETFEVREAVGPVGELGYAVYDTETDERVGDFQSSRIDANRDLQDYYGLQPTEVGGFNAGHFHGHKNILTHARFDEGRGIDGARQLRLQEIQSDWHQKGREKGYKDDSDLRSKIVELEQQLNEVGFAGKSQDYIDSLSDDDFANISNRQTQLVQELETLNKKLESAIPDAPFKNTWHELAMKRVIRWAAENGYDEIVWPVGAQQIDLYQGATRQNVDQIKYIPPTEPIVVWAYGKLIADAKTGEEAYAKARDILLSQGKTDEDIGADLSSGEIKIENRPKPGVASIVGYKDGREVISETIDDPSQLAKRVGPQAASQLIKNNIVEGPGLSVGGQLHKLLYDTKLPQFAQKLAKKFNATYDRVDLPGPIKDDEAIDGEFIVGDEQGYTVNNQFGELVGTAPTRSDAVKLFIDSEFPGIDIVQRDDGTWQWVDNEGRPMGTLADRPMDGATKEEVYNNIYRAIVEEFASEKASARIPVHRLTISPELRKSVLEVGQSAFERETTPKRRIASTKMEQKIHAQWGVPRWNPLVDGGSFIDHVDEARYTTIMTPRGPTIYTNAAGLGVLGALDTLILGQVKSREDLARIRAPEFDQILDHLRDEASVTNGVALTTDAIGFLLSKIDSLADPEFQHIIDNVKAELRRALKQAIDTGNTAIVVISMDRPSEGAILKTLRHEEIHRTQLNLENSIGRTAGKRWDLLDLDWFKTIPNYNKITEGLRMRSYNPKDTRSVALETLAHLGAGQYDVLGMTSKEAAKTFSTILQQIAETYGIDEVRRFNFDPQWKGIINDIARSTEDFRRQVVASTPERTGRGSFFDRIREWWNQRGDSGSRAEVPAGLPESGARARFPWQNVDTSTQAPTYRERIAKFFEDKGLGPLSWNWVDKLHYEVLDDMWPVIKTWSWLTQGQNILPNKDAQILFRNWLGGNRKVDTVLENGMVDAKGNYVTPWGFSGLFEPFQGLSKADREAGMEAAIYLMVGQRTLELATGKASNPQSQINIKAPITGIAGTVMSGDPFANDIRIAISKLKDIYASNNPDMISRVEEAAKRYRTWADKLLDYYEEKGRITTTKANELRNSNRLYVDLHRMFDDHENAILDSTPKKIGDVKKLFREFGGSGEDISNPYLNLLIATDQVIREADRNEALNSFVTPLRDFLLQPNLPPDVRAVFEMIGKRSTDPTKNSLKVWDNGIVDNWEFHPEIMAALENWRNIPNTLVVEAMSLPLRILRTAITHSPGYITRNFIRDSQSRTIISRTFDNLSDALNPLSGSTLWDGMPQLFKPASTRDRQALWLHGGGQAGNYLASRMDYQTRLRDAIRDVAEDRNVIMVSADKVWNFLAKKLPRKVEDANRQAEFQAFKRKGLDAGLSTYDAEIRATFESRDLLDFAVKGRAIRDLNRWILFLNPGIQGLYREYKGIRETPLPFIMRWGLYSLIPTMAELALNRELGDEEGIEEWRQLPAWRKDMFFNIYLGKGGSWNWLTIPKPFTMGVASSIVNRAVDKVFFGNDKAFEDAGGSVARAMLPVDESAFLGPFKTTAEVMMNYSIFYDQPIVTPYEADRDPNLLGPRGTAMGRVGAKAMANTLGQAFDSFARVDPRYVDYFVRGHTSDYGLMAQYLGELINYSFVDDDPKKASDIKWRLAKLAGGNLVRDFKPDQARDVKRVVEEAMRHFGDRAEWFMPVRESLQEFRDEIDPEEKRALGLDAIFAAKKIREFLPEFKSDMTKWHEKVNNLLQTNEAFRGLDKSQQNMVRSELYGEIRGMINEKMSAKVADDPFAINDAEFEIQNFELEMSLNDAIFEAIQAKTDKKLDRVVEPLIPARPGR